MSKLQEKALAKLQALVEDLNVHRARQLAFLSDADMAWINSVRGHTISVSYPEETFQGLGCRKYTPHDISERVNTLVADTVVKMVENRLQPAYLPKSTADALAAFNAEQRTWKPMPIYSMTHAWGRW